MPAFSRKLLPTFKNKFPKNKSVRIVVRILIICSTVNGFLMRATFQAINLLLVVVILNYTNSKMNNFG